MLITWLYAIYIRKGKQGGKKMTRKQMILANVRQDKKLLALFSGAILDVVLLLSLAVMALVWYL